MDNTHITLDNDSVPVMEIAKINLQEGDVLAVKLIGDDLDPSSMSSLKEQLKTLFPNNKIMIFSMPLGSNIFFEAIGQQPLGDLERVVETQVTAGEPKRGVMTDRDVDLFMEEHEQLMNQLAKMEEQEKNGDKDGK